MAPKAWSERVAPEVSAAVGPRWSGAASREPSGAELCRKFGVRNQGPRPANNQEVRDTVPIPADMCPHDDRTEHGGNQWAFYVRCLGCRSSLEFYPRQPTRQHPNVDPMMPRVEAMYSQLPGVQKNRRRKGKGQSGASSTASADVANDLSSETSENPVTINPVTTTASRSESTARPRRTSSSTRGTGSSLNPSLWPVPKTESETEENNASTAAASSGRASKRRTPTPAAPRRITFEAEAPPVEPSVRSVPEPGDEPTEAAITQAPTEALAAMRTLAALPGATTETQDLLVQLEAHLSATTAAAELDAVPKSEEAAKAALSPGTWMQLPEPVPERTPSIRNLP